MTPLDWQDQGACRTADPAIFFPERGGNSKAQVRQAKAICATCPVLDECRQYGLEGREKYGIWGGMTEFERRQYLRTHVVPRRIVHTHGTAAAIRRHRYLGEPLCAQCQWAATDNVATTVA